MNVTLVHAIWLMDARPYSQATTPHLLLSNATTAKIDLEAEGFTVKAMLNASVLFITVSQDPGTQCYEHNDTPGS